MNRFGAETLEAKMKSAAESVLQTFAYDFESRATSITGPGISQTNVYNGLDTRIGSTKNSVAQTYLRDGAYVTDPVLKDSSATYTPGVSERRGSVTAFLHSGLKNADAQTGTAQTVSATRRYDAFGNVVTSTGIWNGPFGYAGGFGYQEDATGLKLLGHRYYDSSTGRFLTRDPQKDGRNWYTYCWNDPVGMVDIDGQNPSGLGGIGAAINEAIKRSKEKPGKKDKDPIKGAPGAGEGSYLFPLFPKVGGSLNLGGGGFNFGGSFEDEGGMVIGTTVKPKDGKISGEVSIGAKNGELTIGSGGVFKWKKRLGNIEYEVTIDDGNFSSGSARIGGGGFGAGITIDKSGRLTGGVSWRF